ncbi:membrane fusion component of tripartite multidrug resistance system [Aquitalea magnusonii]|uniref:Membrane fusion component of tripartite multidrug resistance system n=1 Tax=Aquitalea magnusonii TaxID=332411 RepID=A0A3G9GI48_9NEIS|nr:HlyD family efflux transporter periplasmic adaptor subunit [Aquitalea magnusonii]BBF87165.1 membrane fusion component of tripartite multidrug resistance system [Aquitalea magnusonii]
MDKQIETAKSRKRNLFVATGLIAALAIGYGAYWGLVLSHQESTDDAYVAGHMVQLTPEIAGTVVKISAEDTDRVNSGQTVVAFDNSDAKLAFERARNEFVQTVRETRQLMTSTQQLAAQVAQREAELGRAQSDLKRRETLAGTDAMSAEELGHARDAVKTAQAALDAAREQAKATNALVGKDVLAKQPNVQRAASKLKEAWLALQRTEVKAPVSGYVARRNVQVGQRVAAGTPLMVVVPLDSVWVDANFKEVQLAKIRIGQDVELTADVYGSKISYHGKVQGLSAGTGSAFSLLPAQNATGNWIKVVQRVPVRIQLDPKQLKDHPLRVGLSVDAVVDTSKQDGPTLAQSARDNPVQETRALTPDLKQADDLVASLLAANAQ